MKILHKIQSLSETKRKLILWTVVIIFSLILLFFWLKSVQKRFENLRTEEFREKLDFPQIEMPRIEIPEFSEEELKELERMIEGTEKEILE